jgi:hypothetical protein
MSPDEFLRLVATGLTSEQIAVVMDIIGRRDAARAELDERRKADQRERWRRWKENRDANVSQRLQTPANDSRAGDARAEDKTSSTEKEPLKNNTRAADLAAFKAALSGGCDGERIEAFVKLRRAKRGQLTAHAARLFIADAEASGLSLPAAIDTCVSRNWVTVRPDWLQTQKARAGPVLVRFKDTAADAARRRIEALEHAQQRETGTVVDHQQVAGLLPGEPGRAGG